MNCQICHRQGDQCLGKECIYHPEHEQPLSRQEFLKLPIEERRKRLAHQVDLLRDIQAIEDKAMME